MSKSLPAVLVTGATRGIGWAVARDLGPDHHVLVGGRNPRAVAEVVARLPSAEPFVADLADETAVWAAARKVKRLDGLVHSAGILGQGAVTELTREQMRETFELNVIAVADLTRALIAPLRAARGTVVAINSGSGFNSGPSAGLYAASKFALRALTDALREEERANGVRVSSIHPGRVDTDMQREMVTSRGEAYDSDKYLEAQSVARAVRLALTQTDDAVVEVLSLRPATR